jgi:hypothetical protein
LINITGTIGGERKTEELAGFTQLSRLFLFNLSFTCFSFITLASCLWFKTTGSLFLGSSFTFCFAECVSSPASRKESPNTARERERRESKKNHGSRLEKRTREKEEKIKDH